LSKSAKKDELHIRLSQPAMERLKKLEELSGFRGSRLIEEIIMAVYDVLHNYAEFDLRMDEAVSDKNMDVVAILLMFAKAMETILERVGYSKLLEELEKEEEKLEKKSLKKK